MTIKKRSDRKPKPDKQHKNQAPESSLTKAERELDVLGE